MQSYGEWKTESGQEEVINEAEKLLETYMGQQPEGQLTEAIGGLPSVPRGIGMGPGRGPNCGIRDVGPLPLPGLKPGLNGGNKLVIIDVEVDGGTKDVCLQKVIDLGEVVRNISSVRAVYSKILGEEGNAALKSKAQEVLNSLFDLAGLRLEMAREAFLETGDEVDDALDPDAEPGTIRGPLMGINLDEEIPEVEVDGETSIDVQGVPEVPGDIADEGEDRVSLS